MPKAYYNEFDPRMSAWLESLVSRGLIPDGTVDGRSITDVCPKQLHGASQWHYFCGIAGWPEALRIAGWPKDSPVATASLPCQPWSNGGKRRGTEDERHLAPVFLSHVEELCLPIIFGEQVESPLALEWLDGLFDALGSLGYTCGAAAVPAASILCIHARARLFWVAYSNSFRVPRLEPPGDFGENGQRWQGCPEDMLAFTNSPFLQSARWPQPLLRSSDDGVQKRVAGCHAAGNAIVPALAAEFIQASVEAIALTE